MSVINAKKVTTPYGTEDECLEIITDIQSDGYRLNDVIDLPGTYTFSIWYKSTSASTLSFSILGNAENIQSTNEWKKYVKTVKVTKENIGTNNKIDIIPTLNKAVYLYEGYLVQGTADTSWLPAPEDVDENISSVKSEFTQKADEISMEVTDLDGRMTLISQDLSTITSEVKDNEKNISKVTQTANAVETEIKNARGDKTSLAVRIDGIQTEVTDGEGRISKLEQDVDGFNLAVSNIKQYKYISAKIPHTQTEINTYTVYDKITSWTIVDSVSKTGISIGDTVALKVQNTTTNSYIHLVGEVTASANDNNVSVKYKNLLDPQAGNIANDVKNNLANNYYTKTQTDSEISAKSNEIALSVAKEEVTQKLNGYYTKEDIDSKFKVTDGSITSTVTKVETVEKNLNNLEIGGRNYFSTLDKDLDGDGKVGFLFVNNEYQLANYQGVGSFSQFYNLTVPMNFFYGKAFRISFEAISPNGAATLNPPYNSNNIPLYALRASAVKAPTMSTTTWSKFEYTCTLTKSTKADASEIASNKIEFYCSTKMGVKIRNVKVEVGNKTTDWTPAPEDLSPYEALEKAEDALEKSTDNGKRITTAETIITQLEDSISTLVTDQNGNSLMTQTSGGWQFDIGGIQKSISDTKQQLSEAETDINTTNKLVNDLDKITDDISKKTAHINITTYNGQPALILGQSTSSFKLRITNTSIDFLDGSTTVAYISNKILYIEKAVIKNEIQIGEGSGLVFKKRANGNIGFRWVKGGV